MHVLSLYTFGQFSSVVGPVYIPISKAREFQLLHILPKPCVVCLSHPGRCAELHFTNHIKPDDLQICVLTSPPFLMLYSIYIFFILDFICSFFKLIHSSKLPYSLYGTIRSINTYVVYTDMNPQLEAPLSKILESSLSSCPYIQLVEKWN